MGIWGPGLYDNDCAVDVMHEFQGYLDSGYLPQSAKELIENKYRDMFEDEEDGPIVRIALADQLWSAGALDDNDRLDILDYLQKGGDIMLWEKSAPELLLERKKELARLVAQFCSLPPKKSSKTRRTNKRFHWIPGEVYAIPIKLKYEGIPDSQKEYILLYVFSEGKMVKGYNQPIVCAKLTKNGVLPRNADEFNDLDYIQIAYTPYQDRFKPFCSESDLPMEFRQAYQPDSWGYLHEYTFEVYESRGNHPPESIIFLGQFPDALPPMNNYRRYRSGLCAAWNNLESYVIRGYQLFNLRQAIIYKNTD